MPYIRIPRAFIADNPIPEKDDETFRPVTSNGQLLDTFDAAVKALGCQTPISISTMFNQLACLGT